MDGFSIGRLPGAVRQMLRETPDKHAMTLAHQAQMAESSAFWGSLDGDQMMHLTKIFLQIKDDEDPGARASVYFGKAEMLLNMTHEKCLCGDPHRDPDDLMQELIMRGKESEAIDQACELYKLRRVHTHDLMNQPTEMFVCLDCGQAWESIEQRRQAGDPGKCPGCLDGLNNGETTE